MDPVDIFLAAAVGFVLAGIMGFVAQQLYFAQGRGQESLESRIKRLSEALVDSTKLIDEVTKEIESRHALVEKLERDAETYSRIAELKRAEVEAVAQVLRGELRRQETRGFWRGVLVKFLFFVLGIVVSYLFTIWL